MKKILVLCISLIAVIGLTASGTWAYFNDVMDVEGNTITAGTLYFGTPSIVPLSVSNVAPGAPVASSKVATITNAGTVNGYLRIWLANLANQENTRSDEEMLSGDITPGTTSGGELSGLLKVCFWIDTNGNTTYDAGTDKYLASDKTWKTDALEYGTVDAVTAALTESSPSGSIAINAGATIGDLYVSYQFPNTTTKLSGGIYQATVNAAGSGYAVDDVLTITKTGASGGQVIVTSVDGFGAITGLSLYNAGTGYTTASGLATSGGSGSSATVNIKASSRYYTDNVAQSDSLTLDIGLELSNMAP